MDVEVIRALYKDKLATLKMLADAYQMSETAINNAIRGITYRNEVRKTRRISAAESLKIQRLRSDGMTYEAMPLCEAVKQRVGRVTCGTAPKGRSSSKRRLGRKASVPLSTTGWQRDRADRRLLTTMAHGTKAIRFPHSRTSAACDPQDRLVALRRLANLRFASRKAAVWANALRRQSPRKRGLGLSPLRSVERHEPCAGIL